MNLNCFLPVIRSSLSQKEYGRLECYAIQSDLVWSSSRYTLIRHSRSLEKPFLPIRHSQSVEIPHKLASGEELRLLPFLLAVPIVSIDIIIKH